MEYDIEEILYNFEDDYNPGPRPMNQGPRNMNQGGRIGFKGGYRVEDMTSAEIKSAQGNARKKGYSSKLGSESFTEFLANEYRSKAEQQKDFEKLKQKNLKDYQSKFSPEAISQKTGSLTKKEITILNKSYQNIFKEEFDRLLNEGELFSKSDLSRSVINRIADENPTIDLTKGTGLDKLPGGGDERSKTTFDNINKLFTKKQKANFTTNTNALAYTKNQDRLLQALLSGNTDFDDLAEDLGFNEGRLKGNVNKLMRNLAFTDKSQQPLFFKKYSQEDLEKARNAVFDSPTLESAYQRTALQSILASTVEGSKQRKDALNKYKEFNKFKSVMKENGIDPKLVAMDHAASYRAIKNGNVKNFLAMTPIMSDINAIKSTFDRRSQLNLRRMQDAITSGDNASYKKFLKNQKELEGVWKTMTGDQSSLGKIRIGATGKKKGVTKIFDYGATSILDKNKNLLNELGDNLVIRENIVKASTEGNLDEVSRIMFEGSEAKKPRPSKLPESFKNLNKPEMFKTENQIRTLLADLGCPKSLQKASGGRIKYSKGTSCSIKGREVLEQGLKNGFKETDQSLARGILKSGKFLKDAVSLRGLFGPAALAFTVAAEAGIVGYDMLSGGKSFREAVGDSVFNYMLGDKTKIDSEEEFIKRLKNVPGSPGQGFRGFTDDDINKMLVFKSKLDDMQTGFSNYSDLLDINEKIKENTERQNIGSGFFPDEAFQLEAKKDKIQADIRDYNKVGTPRNVTEYMISDEGVKGGDALARGTLLAKESQLLDAYRSSPKGIENLKKDLIDTRFNLEQKFNPTKYNENAKYFMGLPKSEQSKLMSYENMLDPFREKFMSKPKSEQSRIMSYGYPRYMEGGIASLNVNKK